MPRQVFFLHTSDNLLRVTPPRQTAWLREVRGSFASTWTEDDTANLPAGFVYVPWMYRICPPAGTYGRFHEALFPSVPWMQFKRGSVWGTTRLSPKLSAEFWRITGRSDLSDVPAVSYLFVIIRDPTMPPPRKHPDWLIHGYPTWTDHSAALRLARRAASMALLPGRR